VVLFGVTGVISGSFAGGVVGVTKGSAGVTAGGLKGSFAGGVVGATTGGVSGVTGTTGGGNSGGGLTKGKPDTGSMFCHGCTSSPVSV
jgi:hypothetical protein